MITYLPAARYQSNRVLLWIRHSGKPISNIEKKSRSADTLS